MQYDFEEVTQGALNDCYLLGSLGAIINKEELIDKIFGEHNDNYVLDG